MLKKTEDEIKDWLSASNSPLKGSSVFVGGNYVEIRLEDPTDLEFSTLQMLSEFFETRRISVDNEKINEGCETCGYGATTYQTFTIKPDNGGRK